MKAMKRRVFVLLLVLSVCRLAHGQYVAVSGNCELPGQAAVVSGLPQSGTQPLSGSPFTTGSGVMASYPQCLVTVYPAESGTPVPTGNVYSNTSGSVLGNPFTSNTDGSWKFYVTAGCYDVALSSGTGPAAQMPATKTLPGKCSGGSSTVSASAQYDVAYYSAPGTASALNGAAITGFQYDSTSGPPTAATAVQAATLIQALTGCGTAGYVFTPAGLDCVANGGGGGGGNVSTAPSFSQDIVQPPETEFSANSLSNIRYVTASWNWAQVPSDNLSTPGSNTVHLAPCPDGIDVASSSNHYVYRVYIWGTGTPEAVPVTGGTCQTGNSTGTIVITTAYAHSSGYWVGSASGGIQEAWNDAWISDGAVNPNAGTLTAPYVKLMADTQYNIYSSIYMRGRGGILDGAGALLACATRDRCVYIGNTTGQTGYHKLYNVSATSTMPIAGTQVSNICAGASCASPVSNGTFTFTVPQTVANITSVTMSGLVATFITTAPCSFTGGQPITVAGVSVSGYNTNWIVYSTEPTPCSVGIGTSTFEAVSPGVSGLGGGTGGTATSTLPFVAGDPVSCEVYSQAETAYFVSTVLAAGLSATQFEMTVGSSANFAAPANTFGFCGALDAFIEDNSDHVTISDLNLFQANSSGIGPLGFGIFDYGIVNDNDQSLIIDRAANRASSIIRSDNNFPAGAFVFDRPDQLNAGIAYIKNSEFTNINCFTGGPNGAVIADTVCQAFPFFGIRYFGGLQPITMQNVYQETSASVANPLYSGGLAAQMGSLIQGGFGSKILGVFPLTGWEPVFAAGGSGIRNYWVVVHSSTQGTGPMMFIGYAQPLTGGTNILLQWPSVELQTSAGASLGTVTWDVLMTTGSGTAQAAPYGTGNYAVATGISGSCGTNGMCNYADTQAGTSSYTVPTGGFSPVFWFWPSTITVNNNTVLVDYLPSNPYLIASQGTQFPAAVTQSCAPGNSWATYTPISILCLSATSSTGQQYFATLFPQTAPGGNSPATNSKGRLNLTQAIAAPSDILTLVDSNLAKTLATAGNRPPNDAADMALGLDQNGGLSVRAATSLSSYINVVQDNTSWLERLTGSAKTLKVPLVAAGSLPTLSGTGACATTSTQVGGAWSGKFTCTGTTGSSTVVITPGATAPHGWNCSASDETAGTAMPQSADSTTTCTIKGTVSASDVLTFTATAY